MKTLKYNEVYLKDYETYTDVLRQLPYVIEEVYNRRQLHSSLSYLTPQEFEVKLKNREKMRSPKPSGCRKPLSLFSSPTLGVFREVGFNYYNFYQL